MVSIRVEFPADEIERITAPANELGYATPSECMRALVEQEVHRADSSTENLEGETSDEDNDDA